MDDQTTATASPDMTTLEQATAAHQDKLHAAEAKQWSDYAAALRKTAEAKLPNLIRRCREAAVFPAAKTLRAKCDAAAMTIPAAELLEHTAQLDLSTAECRTHLSACLQVAVLEGLDLPKLQDELRKRVQQTHEECQQFAEAMALRREQDIAQHDELKLARDNADYGSQHAGECTSHLAELVSRLPWLATRDSKP